MSKYNEEVFDAALGAYLNFSGTEQDSFEAALDTLERAPWWEEIKPGYEFRIGEPYRVERADVNYEGVNTLSTLPAGGTARFFRDTRWTPPPAPLAVGDVIEALEDLERLPVGAGFVDQDRDLWQVDRDECGETIGASMAGGSWEGFTAVIYYAPLTVVYLPESGATE